MSTAALEPSLDLPLDTTVRLITPERIAFNHVVAGPFRRSIAYLIDLVVMGLLSLAVLVVALIIALGAPSGLGLYFVALFGLQFGYGAFCEGLFNGQTVGKWLLGIRVVSVEGLSITGAQAFLRNLLWAFDGLAPFAYLPAILCMMLTSRFQRLGDLAAGTMVVVEDRPRRGGVIRIEEPAVQALLPHLPARIEAGPELARALSDYVKHRSRFSPERREEMARHLADAARIKYELPAQAPADAILGALYHRVFLEG